MVALIVARVDVSWNGIFWDRSEVSALLPGEFIYSSFASFDLVHAKFRGYTVPII